MHSSALLLYINMQRGKEGSLLATELGVALRHRVGLFALRRQQRRRAGARLEPLRHRVTGEEQRTVESILRSVFC